MKRKGAYLEKRNGEKIFLDKGDGAEIYDAVRELVVASERVYVCDGGGSFKTEVTRERVSYWLRRQDPVMMRVFLGAALDCAKRQAEADEMTVISGVHCSGGPSSAYRPDSPAALPLNAWKGPIQAVRWG